MLPDIEDQESLERYWDRIDDWLSRHAPTWRLRREVVLAELRFGLVRMWKDLDPDIWPTTGLISPPLAELLGDADARSAPADWLTRPASTNSLDLPHPQTGRWAPPIVRDADSTQHRAIWDIVEPRPDEPQSSVIVGPPGTGKSQTIVNLIAEVLRRGERVLFVAQKQAALDVVYQRLVDDGLDRVTLQLYGPHDSKDAIAQRLGAMVASRRVPTPEYITAERQREMRALTQEHTREMRRLHDTAVALATPQGPFAMPVSELMTRACVVPSGLDTGALASAIHTLQITDETRNDPATPQRWAEMLRDSHDAYHALTDRGGPILDIPWRGVGESSDVPLEVGDVLAACEAVVTASSRLEHLVGRPISGDMPIRRIAETLRLTRHLFWRDGETVGSVRTRLVREMSTAEELAHLTSWISRVTSAFLDPATRVSVAVPPSDGETRAPNEAPPSVVNTMSNTLASLTGARSINPPINSSVNSSSDSSFTPPRSPSAGATVSPPVDSLAHLPAAGNERGDIRLFWECVLEGALSLRPHIVPLALEWMTPPLREMLTESLATYQTARRQIEALGETGLMPSSCETRRDVAALTAACTSPVWNSFRVDVRQAVLRWQVWREKGDSLALSRRERLQSALHDLTCLSRFYHAEAVILESPITTQLICLDHSNTRRTSLEQPGGAQAGGEQPGGAQAGGAQTGGAQTTDSRFGSRRMEMPLRESAPSTAPEAGRIIGVGSGLRLAQKIHLAETIVAQGQWYQRMEALSSMVCGGARWLSHVCAAPAATWAQWAVMAQETSPLEQAVGQREKSITSVSFVVTPSLHRPSHSPPHSSSPLPFGDEKLSDISYVFPSDTSASLSIIDAISIAPDSLAIGKLAEVFSDLVVSIDAATTSLGLSREVGFGRAEDASTPADLVTTARVREAMAEAALLPLWLSWHAARRRVQSANLSSIADVMLTDMGERAVSGSSAKASMVASAAFAQVWARYVLDTTPVLRGFDGTRHEEARRHFADLDRRRIQAQAQDVVATLLERPLRPQQITGHAAAVSGIQLIQQQAAAARRRSVRSLVAAAGDDIADLAPCICATPSSLARHVPPEALTFDLLIIDEASQMTPEAALGALARARRVVVVGDPRQLGPEGRFQGSGQDMEEEDDVGSESDASFASALFDSPTSLHADHGGLPPSERGVRGGTTVEGSTASATGINARTSSLHEKRDDCAEMACAILSRDCRDVGTTGVDDDAAPVQNSKTGQVVGSNTEARHDRSSSLDGDAGYRLNSKQRSGVARVPGTVLERSQSLLDAASELWPTRLLSWHYRSRHPDLIAFSNRQYYDGRLTVFPVPSRVSKDGVHLDRVTGYATRAGRRLTNPIEGARVVELVTEHALATPERSLLVATFNRPQQELIERLLQQDTTPSTREFFQAQQARGTPCVVKNLETLQGEERDVVIISTTFARENWSGAPAPAYFGPIAQRGGERRINVLITRARHRMVVVSSLEPMRDLRITPSTRAGVRDFRDFLLWAEKSTGIVAPSLRGTLVPTSLQAPSSEKALSTSSSKSELPSLLFPRQLVSPSTQGSARLISAPRETSPADSFCRPVSSTDFWQWLGQQLTRRGYAVVHRVGEAGAWVDLAVVDPRDPTQFALGILGDGSGYHHAASTRDRDRLFEQQLCSLGWTLHRVWSIDWFRHPEAEMKRLLAALPSLITDTF